VREARQKKRLTQEALAAKLQIEGVTMERDSLSRIEIGTRFVTDYELKVDQDILQQFVVTDNIFEDGLSKDALFKTIKRVFKAKLHCIMLLNYAFGNSNTNISKPHNENSMFV